MNVNVGTNVFHVIYMFYSGNVPVNEARKFSWERSIAAGVILVLSASHGSVCVCVCVCVCVRERERERERERDQAFATMYMSSALFWDIARRKCTSRGLF
jgi:hypothetical protein